MRFTSIRTDKNKQMRLCVHEAAWFMERMTYETQECLISGFRNFLKRGSRWGSYMKLDKIARVCVNADYHRTPTGDLSMRTFNGLVVLEVRQVPDLATLEQLKRRAMQSPSTWAAFIGASGHTVKILVRAEPYNGILPQDEVSAEDFYTSAYHQLLPFYDGLLGCRVTRMTPRLRYAFLMPLDAQPLVNDAAVPFRITDMPSAATDEDEQHLLALPEPPRSHREVDMERYSIHEHLYAQAVDKAYERLEGTPHFTNAWWKGFVSSVVTDLCRQGVGEEEAVCVTWNNLRYKDEPGLTQDFVRAIAEAIFEQEKAAGGSRSKNVAEPLMQTIIRRLSTRYVLRNNTVMGYTEYRPNHTWATPWAPVTDKVINTFTTDLQLAGLDVWDRDVKRYINSTRICDYNPIMEYLWECHGKWDGRDRISALAATVPTDNPAQWAEWFHTWFLAMVAQWQERDRRYGNSIVPLLISAQGMHKSTFCRSLLPPELRSWGYTDNLSLAEERSVHLAMSQMLLINLDEFNRISPQKQQGFLKNILQLPSVKVKRPYGKHIEEVPRLASFIATTNMADVLTDPSGSRRFLGVNVKGSIDVSRTPNHEQLYAQALQELENGSRYWFDDAETEQIMRHNRQFQQVSGILQYFFEYFEPGEGDNGSWLTATALLQELKKLCGGALPAFSLNAFGRQLRGLENLLTRHSRIGELYYVQKRKRQ